MADLVFVKAFLYGTAERVESCKDAMAGFLEQFDSRWGESREVNAELFFAELGVDGWAVDGVLFCCRDAVANDGSPGIYLEGEMRHSWLAFSEAVKELASKYGLTAAWSADDGCIDDADRAFFRAPKERGACYRIKGSYHGQEVDEEYDDPEDLLDFVRFEFGWEDVSGIEDAQYFAELFSQGGSDVIEITAGA